MPTSVPTYSNIPDLPPLSAIFQRGCRQNFYVTTEQAEHRGVCLNMGYPQLVQNMATHNIHSFHSVGYTCKQYLVDILFEHSIAPQYPTSAVRKNSEMRILPSLGWETKHS